LFAFHCFPTKSLGENENEIREFFLLPFAYVFNKFEIFSGITICSEQYILDKTIFFSPASKFV
jgi:hypothetical protein